MSEFNKVILAAVSNYKKRHDLESFDPRTALFDMDGVLYDSMPNHALSWHRSMADYDIEMTEYEAFLYEGMRGVEVIKKMAKAQWGRDITDEEAQQMYARKAHYFSQFPPAKMISGVYELQQQMKEWGMTIGIVTGSGQKVLIDRILTDFDGLVEPLCIVTALDVERGKPQPDPYLAGMRKAGSKPWQTVVIENAPLGVKAAVAAECFTIAVNTGPLVDKELIDAGADIVVKTMDDAKNVLELIIEK